MKVKSIAECSSWSILQYFWPSFSYRLSLRSLLCLFLSGCLRQVLHDLILYVLGWTSTKLVLMRLAQGHNAVTLVRLEEVAPRSRIKHSTTEPLRSLRQVLLYYLCHLFLLSSESSELLIDRIYPLGFFTLYSLSLGQCCHAFLIFHLTLLKINKCTIREVMILHIWCILMLFIVMFKENILT